MEQAVMNARQEKQSYICDNIDPNFYQDFHDFCNSFAGHIDIDKWPLAYVHQLVERFKDQLKKRLEQQDNQERSFAIYQTTSGDQHISGSRNLQMNEILETLEQSQRSSTTSNVSPTTTKQNYNRQNQQQKSEASQRGFRKKEKAQKSQDIAKKEKEVEKDKANKVSALQLLDSAFESVGQGDRSKMEENAEKVSKSFFDSVNFWEVPKVEEIPNEIKKQEIMKAKSPKKEFKSIKLNLNVNQLTHRTTNSKSHEVFENNFMTKNPVSARETTKQNISSKGSAGGEFIKVHEIKEIPKNDDFKSEFDTFSQIAESQIKKNKDKKSPLNEEPFDEKKNYTNKIDKSPNVRDTKQQWERLPKKYTVKYPYKGPRMIQKEFVDQVPCFKSTIRSYLGEQNLRIKILAYNIVQRSFFSSNYLMYDMKVLPNGFTCKRNYEDFSKLRCTLEKFYPCIQLPFLEKQGWRSDTTQEYAKKQIKMIEFFMDDIFRNPQLRNSRIVQEFLTFQEHKKMKRKFEEYDKMTKLKSIEELCLLPGKVEILLTEKERIYNEAMGKLILKIDSNFDKYRRNCQALSAMYSQIMSTILTIDDTIKQIQKDFEQFNKTVVTKELVNIQDSFQTIRDHYKQNYTRVKFEKQIIEERILPFVKYEKENTYISRTILDLSSYFTTRFLKREHESTQVSESSYLSSHFAEHKQGILDQSKNLLVLKYQTGYLQSQACSETFRIMTNLGGKIQQLWRGIGQEYLEQLSKSVGSWSRII